MKAFLIFMRRIMAKLEQSTGLTPSGLEQRGRFVDNHGGGYTTKFRATGRLSLLKPLVARDKECDVVTAIDEDGHLYRISSMRDDRSVSGMSTRSFSIHANGRSLRLRDFRSRSLSSMVSRMNSAMGTFRRAAVARISLASRSGNVI